MRTPIPTLLAAALLLLALPSGAACQPRDSAGTDLEAAIGEMAPRIPHLMDRDGVPGLVVVVLRRGAPMASAAFGFADPASGRRMTVDALFRVESISKPVTAWGVLRLVEAGVLGLDDPVQAHLVRWAPPPATPPLAVVELLSNTGGVGLGDYSARYPPEGPVPPLSASLDGEFEQVAPPGEEFRYSDTGFNLLQLVVEEVTGRPFDAFMEAEVLGPLGMTEATYRWTAERAERMPVGHSLRGDPVAPYVYPGLGSGGLLATAQAIARFAVASMEPPWGSGGPVLSDDGVRRLHQERVAVGGLYAVVADGYGLGHFTERLSDGRHAVWHGGQGYGWMSHVHVVPSSGDGIVLLANSQRAWPLFAAVLGSWSRTLGVEPVKMARIGWARPLALAGIALMLVGAVGVGRGWLRRPAGHPIGPASTVIRGGVGVGLLALVGWCATREYLFLFSVLPATSRWLGGAGVLLALVLVVSALPGAGSRPGRS